ncbi:MAG: exopolyphosphatase [Desulfovibrionaceae bacterium]|nr:exopolyphosphatase [Desulfovibrionaceae bacterium]
MRLVTRSDFDGLACAVLLRSIGLIEEYKFAHPKDLQDGLVDVTDNDVLANVPYVNGCGMWFDHHSSEHDRLGVVEFEGSSKLAPSCARVIWDYYNGHESFPASLDSMMEAVDKVDSANLSREDILHPKDWVLLGMIMDPRTGLGRYRDYRISNYQLMLDMINYCNEKSAEEILENSDVKERTDRYFAHQKDFVAMLSRCSKTDGNVLVIDLRDEPEIFSGNRFTVYALYPDTNVSVQVIWGLKQQNVVITVGHSILNRGCTADVGKLMLAHGGGGHFQVGTCQVATEKAAQAIQEIVQALKGT